MTLRAQMAHGNFCLFQPLPPPPQYFTSHQFYNNDNLIYKTFLHHNIAHIKAADIITYFITHCK